MRSAIRVRVWGTLVIAAVMSLLAAPAMASVPSAGSAAPYTCSGGEVPSGDYASLAVTGACTVGSGAVITVAGNVTVAAGAAFDAQSAPATITINQNVTAARGSFLGLGCQPPAFTGNSAHECTVDPEGHSTITVGGNVTATDAAAVLLNGITVKRNVALTGGGSAIPWAIKNNTIGGNLSVSGQVTDWLGVLFNTVSGNVALSNITVTDQHPGAPGVYIVRNVVARNLTCSGLLPGVSGGFVPGSVNTVGRNATGQCVGL